MDIHINENVKRIAKISLIVFLIVTALAFWKEKALYFLELKSEDEVSDFSLPCYDSGDLSMIEIKGEIVSYMVSGEDESMPDATSSEDVISCINDAKDNYGISAVVFNIDSYGGSPFASEEIMKAIKRLPKPSVAVIRESGVSGAYLIASATSRIFASELSDIGGIGVSASYLDYSGKNKQEGVTYQEISAGKFKDTGNPDKPLTTEEKEFLMRDVKILHEAFIKNVSKNRKLDVEKVRKLADGSSMLGNMAKDNGLIDEIGGIEEAENWLFANSN